MLDWMTVLSVEDRLAAIGRAFEKLGSTDEGMIVLAVLLDDLCFMEPCKSEQERAWNEYAKVLLKRCGRNLAARAVDAWVNIFSKEIDHGNQSGHEP
jgi:hypothetical protein